MTILSGNLTRRPTPRYTTFMSGTKRVFVPDSFLCYNYMERGRKKEAIMKAAARKEIRERPKMQMGRILPMTLPGNPFKGGTKFASVEATMKKGGFGVFFKLKF